MIQLSKIDISQLSEHKTQIMGLAALMIIVCHAPASGVIMPNILARIMGLGNFGVDIFLFLSGLGCYYSLNKNRGGYFCYLKRRFSRLMIPYLLISFPFCLFYLLLGRDNLLDTIYCLTTLEYWLFHKGAWFVSFMIPLYLFSPALYKICDGTNKSWIYVAILIFITTYLSSVPSLHTVVSNIQSALLRMPSFLIGMAIAPYCMNKKAISVKWGILLVSCYLIFTALHIRQYAIWAIMPVVMYISIFLVKLLSKIHILNEFVTLMGNISLESYLTNIYLNSLFIFLIPDYISSPIFYGRYVEYVTVIVLGIAMAYAYKVCFERYFNKKFNVGRNIK